MMHTLSLFGQWVVSFKRLPTLLSRVFCLGLCVALTACGFTLKGTKQLPFNTIYTNLADNTEFASNLQRALQASSPGLQFVNDPAQAQVQLIQISSNEWLRDLSLDAAGRVEEYELNLEFVFQLLDNQGRVILEPTTLRSVRELPYDDNVVQAKQSEINVVFKSMRQSLIERILYLMSSPAVLNAFQNPDTQPYQELLPNPSSTPAPGGRPLWGAPVIDPGAANGGL